MKRILALLVALLLPAAASARPQRVVATLPDLAALTRAVGQDHVEVESLSLPTQDPHFVDARPNLALTLHRADLLVVAGLELEVGWLPTLLTGARNPDVQPGAPGYLDASQYVALRGVPQVKIDRSMGDIHPGGNPHYLFDARNGVRVARAIAERLAVLDPAHAEVFRANLAAFETEARERIAAWEALLAPHTGSEVITYHRSWIYLLGWFGLEVAGTLEPKPGIPPSPAHVGRLLVQMRTRRPALLLQEAYYPDATAKLLGEKTGTPLLVLPGGTDFQGGERYLDHVDELVRMLHTTLKEENGK